MRPLCRTPDIAAIDTRAALKTADVHAVLTGEDYRTDGLGSLPALASPTIFDEDHPVPLPASIFAPPAAELPPPFIDAFGGPLPCRLRRRAIERTTQTP
jgi:hypothetical protein